MCVWHVQGKYEFRNFINTKTTKREAQTANVLKALGDKEYEVRYSDKTRAAPLPLFRVRRYERTDGTHLCACIHPFLSRAHRFDRKCRDFERAYLCYQTPRAIHRATIKNNGTGYKVIKNIIKKVKAHRCTGAIQSKVCQDDKPAPPTELLQTLQL